MESPSMPRFHAESDVAAVVYGVGDDPDALLRRFLDRRIAQGHDALGVVQTRAIGGAGPLRTASFQLLPDFEWGTATIAIRPRDRRCADALSTIGEKLIAALDRRPDVLVLNRFGRAEASGRGLLGLLAGAVEAEVPVLIAVPDGLFRCWLDVTGGLAVKIRPMEVGLETWWRSLGHGFRSGDDHASPCALVK